jgi:hypothetical protein
VQDVYGQISLACTPGGKVTNHLEMDEIPIALDGSFSKTTNQQGVIEQSVANFTYTFRGEFVAGKVTGTLSEQITYGSGQSFQCTSGTESWSATRDSQGVQSGFAPPPGSYSGDWFLPGNVISPLQFYVSPDGSHVQDVYAQVSLPCMPGGEVVDHLEMDEIPIAPDGSFSKVTEQNGVFKNAPAHIEYTFSGHLHGTSSSGAARMAGTLRENVTIGGGSTFECTSNNQSWAAEQPKQGAQTLTPPPGSYSADVIDLGNVITPFSFTVSANSSRLTAISVQVGLACSPGPNLNGHIVIPEVAIGQDGSFATTIEEPGEANGVQAKFTYTFAGHFHGFAANGTPRLAGTVREDVVPSSGSAFSCTSNNQSWSATGPH